MRPIDETIEDIRRQAQLNRGKKITSCFLQDGDALVLKTDYLLRNMDSLIAIGSSAAIVYGIYAVYKIGIGFGHGDMATVHSFMMDLYRYRGRNGCGD